MKSSLKYNQALFLSVSAILLIASGCDERRGRAPIKSVSAGPAVVAPATANAAKLPGSVATPIPSGTSGTTTTTNSNGTTSTTQTKTTAAPANEAQLVSDSQMTCDAAEVDDTASPTSASFQADLLLENQFQACMKTAGLVVKKLDAASPDAKRILDSSPTANTDATKNSTAYTMFLSLAKSQGDDVKAQTIMTARIQLSELRLGKMLTKYSDDRLRSAKDLTADTVFTADTDPNTGKADQAKVSDILGDISKSIAALDAGLDDVSKMQSVSNGGDLSQSEIDSRNQSKQLTQ